MPLESIRALVKADLEATDQFIYAELSSDIQLINELVDHVLKCGGKRIRPLLVLLAARTLNYSEQAHIRIATAIELIHTATLLHDDVVDHSDLRRGRQTAHMIWGNEASVLVGDFLYSRAFQLIVRLQHLPIINIFSDATNIIAEGEVLQLLNCHDPETTEHAYYEVIKRKTAKLFEVATHAGATLASNNPAYLSAMLNYGSELGIAYQLIDDALDYSVSSDTSGKNMGTDLAEGKPTLPLIYALSKGTTAEAALIRDAIKNNSQENLTQIIEVIESTRAIEYTANAAKAHALRACEHLAILPESPYRLAMQQLAEFVVERNY